jgi:hypothetical protein
VHPPTTSSIASMPGGSSSVVAGLGIFRQTALGGVQTEAPKRSTKSAVPR